MSDWDDEDDLEPEPSPRDRLSSLRRRAKRRTGRALRAIRLSRWADALDPPLTPWWLRRPLGYKEIYSGIQDGTCDICGETSTPAHLCSCWVPLGAMPEFEDVLLAAARYKDDQKRDKLTLEVFTNPDPDMAGRAVEELRWMSAEGKR